MAYPRVVRIRNDGESLFTGKWAGEKYTVPPGSETLVEWDAICNWFGHPNAIDVPGDKRKRFRTDELHRLFVKYGIYENHHLQEERFPKVSVWDISTGQQYITVINDPQGKNLTPETQTIAENQNLHEQMRLMQEQMAFLQAQLAQRNADGNANPMPQPQIGDESAVAPENRPEIPTHDHDSSLVDDAEVDMPVRPKAVART